MNLQYILDEQKNNTAIQPPQRKADEFADSMATSVVAKCEQNIEAASLLLETQDTTSALKHIRIAKKIIREMSSTKQGDKKKELDVKARGCHARILEASDKYLAASWNYFQITMYDDLKSDDYITNKELVKGTDNAIKCCILAKACNARDELLLKLYEDERSRNSPRWNMLKNMHEQRIICNQDQEDFGKMLPLKDQLKLIGEYTILQKAVYEHNMRAIARLYKNINIKDLSVLLGISMDGAEDLARIMIIENRLSGTIDQIDNEITFHQGTDIKSWDIEIKETLLSLQKCVEMINGDNDDVKSIKHEAGKPIIQ